MIATWVAYPAPIAGRAGACGLFTGGCQANRIRPSSSTRLRGRAVSRTTSDPFASADLPAVETNAA